MTSLILGMIWYLDYPPFQDFNETLYQSRVLALLLSGHSIEFACLQFKPVPNSLGTLLLTIPTAVLAPMTAAKVALTTYIGAATLLSWKLAHKFDPDKPEPLAVLLLICIFLGSPFWNGYWNYLIGLLLFGFFILTEERWMGRPMAMAVLLALCFFCHAFPFTVLAMYLGLKLLQRRQYSALVAVLMPSTVLVWTYKLAPGPQMGDYVEGFGFVKHLAYKAYTLFKVGPYRNFVFHEGGDYVRNLPLYSIGIAVNIAFGLLLFSSLAMSVWARWKRGSLAIATLGLMLGVLLVYIALPNSLLAVVNPGERILYPLLLLALCRFNVGQRSGTILAVSLTFLVAPVLFMAGRDHSQKVGGEAMTQHAQVLFSYRPTAFVDRVKELTAAHQEGRAPGMPLEFQTGMLFNRAPQSSCDETRSRSELL